MTDRLSTPGHAVASKLVEEPDAIAVELILDSTFRELGLPAAIPFLCARASP